MPRRPDLYAMYERAVQTPEIHVEMFAGIYRDHFGKYARHLREDFCGSFAICREWVKRNRRNTAQGLDLDPEPLRYGIGHHASALSAAQKKRLHVRPENVLSITSPKVDLIVACNFSFYVFKERRVLLDYFRACLRSLSGKGMVILEMLGGPGAVETIQERKTIREKGHWKFTYYWDQKSFDPITHRALYAIHFRLPDGTKIRNAFSYDWRLWTIPEVRDALREAGFGETAVYWETEHNGEGTGEYVRTEQGDNAYSWVAYVCGIKRS